MSTAGTYLDAQDIDVLSMLARDLGHDHDNRVVTLLQGIGNEGVERFAGGGKLMIGSGSVNHFAGAAKMMVS